jgi:hypothetical protein
VTARWVVDQVAPQRELQINWQPISLLFKNDPDPESPYYAGALLGHRALRIMEAIRAEHSDEAVFAWYWQCGTLIHHDADRDIDFGAALERVGLDPALAAAADDTRWDEAIRTGMDAGLALVGNDVGTPIIAFTRPDGREVAVFGPVITKYPAHEDGLKLWDAVVTLASMDEFWELKRTRTVRPEFGDAP